MTFHRDNWDSYFAGFHYFFSDLQTQPTDVNRFPQGANPIPQYTFDIKELTLIYLDDRDGNGFWEGYTVNSVHGKFHCNSEGCDNPWRSVKIQVDMKA